MTNITGLCPELKEEELNDLLEKGALIESIAVDLKEHAESLIRISPIIRVKVMKYVASFIVEAADALEWNKYFLSDLKAASIKALRNRLKNACRNMDEITLEDVKNALGECPEEQVIRTMLVTKAVGASLEVALIATETD